MHMQNGRRRRSAPTTAQAHATQSGTRVYQVSCWSMVLKPHAMYNCLVPYFIISILIAWVLSISCWRAVYLAAISRCHLVKCSQAMASGMAATSRYMLSVDCLQCTLTNITATPLLALYGGMISTGAYL